MQADLFPTTKPEYKDIPLKELPEFPGAIPTAQMVGSVKRLGVLEPILMRGEILVAGRRRVNAARIAGLTEIPARVFPEDFSNEYILSLVENENRRHNPLSDLRSVEALLAEGKDEKEISRETGIAAQRLRKILQLRKLIRPLRRSFEDGMIKYSVAVLASKKPENVQNRLLEQLEHEGFLRLKDVHQIGKVEKKIAVGQLPDSLFGDVVPAWKPDTIKKLQEIKRLIIKDADTDWIDNLDRLIEELE